MRSIARSVLLVSSLLAAASVTAVERCFPPDFLFGSATASYQVEGGWNATGRTPSIWDDYCRAKPNVECANVADDFVHRYAQDIDLMVATGLSSFRFSVSWSRVMRWDKPSQRMVANADGIAFYHSVVDTLRLKGIVPILTLYHWDLPSALHTELSPPGWLNAGIADHFVEYAELMYREFGAKVDLWTTFNEPTSFVIQGYGTGLHAPAMPQSPTNTYTVAHNVLRSHAAAVSKFREFKTQQVVNAHARIGIVLVTDYSYPLDPQNDADVEAANRKMDFMFGWFLRPIVHGDYPSVMRSRVGDRLPTFTAEESASLKGSYDLFMLNHYHSKVVTDCTSSRSSINCSALSLGWEQDHGIDDTRRPEGARPSSTGPNGEYLCTWFSAYPQGYLDTIRWMHNYDPEAQILLTENGWCGNSTIDNPDQMWYFQQYLKQVHIAVNEMKIPIIGYTAWSFVDNYEWGSFGPRFGLYYVDYPAQTGSKEDWTPKDSDLKRIPRTAAKWYGSLAKTKCMEIDGDDYEQSSSATSSSSSSVGSAAWLFAVIAVVIGVVGVVVVRRRRAATRDEQSPLIRR